MKHFLSLTSVALALLMTASTAVAQSSSSSSAVPINISVTDGKTNILPGASVIYAVTVSQSAEPNLITTVELELPSYAELLSPDRGGIVTGTTVRWTLQDLQRNQSYVYTVQARYKTSTPNGETVVATARVESSSASDSTTVGTSSSSSAGSFSVEVTDGKTTVRPGGDLTYTVTAVNGTASDMITEVRLRVPGNTQTQSTAPASTQQQDVDIVWANQSFAPNESKTYTVRVTVQSHLTDYVLLTAQAVVGGAFATDTTSVLRSTSSSSSVRSSSSSSSRRSTSTTAGNVLFAKESNKSEVVPGDTITYVLFVQNVLLNRINDAVITDRFNPSQMSVENTGGATAVRTGELQWTLPSLGPGETWQRTYTLRVSDTLPHGTEISNVATIAGSDVQTATLSEKVSTIKTGIVTNFPETGFPYDVLFLYVSGALSAAAVFGIKRA